MVRTNTILIRNYYSLTKPGIIYGNALTAAAGFFLASRGDIAYGLFFAMLLGLSLIIASSCVFNNYIDRDIDKLMERTKERVLVKGLIPRSSALIFATCLCILGVLVLGLFTNMLALFAALVGFFVYVVCYSLWGKRNTWYGTVIGSISGAMPPVVGYIAVTAQFDVAALLLFFILCFWQMPHFFAIAMYRIDDYVNAKIPVLPIARGLHAAKIHMAVYIIAFIIAAAMLTFLGYTGYIYLGVLVLLGLAWLGMCVKGFRTDTEKGWARRMFLFSIIIIFAFCVMIVVDGAN